GARERYLAEEKPVHTIISMSLYAGLRGPQPSRRLPRDARVLALGDPVYRAVGATVAPAQGALVTRGVGLTPLPHTREEVAAISRLFPRQAMVRTGADARKAVVVREGTAVRILHFACHGLVDNQDPLASALALSPEGDEDDGLLRAYEVMEKLHLH